MTDPSPRSEHEKHADRIAHEAEEIETVEDRLSAMAGRAGISSLMQNEALSGSELLKILGGVRGLVETLLPGIMFVAVYAGTQKLALSLGASLGLSVIFVSIRVLQKSQARSATAGLIAAAASAAVALLTGNAENNYLISLIINAVYGAGLLLSILIGWPIIGVFVGFLMGDGVAWRKNKRRFSAMVWLTLMWVGLFALRLAVELPLYFAGEVVLLGVTRLVLGTPLYAVFIVFTWLVTRAVYPRAETAKTE